MVDDQLVRTEASNIAADARKTRDLSDAESECLRDLLASDEAFGALVTAQQNAVLVDEDVDEDVDWLATDAADKLGRAIDLRIDVKIAQAKDVIALAYDDAAGESLTWTVAMQLHQAGFTTVTDLREADQQELIDEADIAPSLAARLKADHGGPEEVQG